MEMMPNICQIIIDGNRANTHPAAAHRGLGFVTGNGSSRLLLDYKRLHPAMYEEILRLLFAPGVGAGITHLKLEFGTDINSSSGTEPCTMRAADAPADVTRGAGFQLAADARRHNPALTLDLLRWGEPHWVTAAFADGKEAGFAARYRWFYETLLAAYETYGLEFDYISPDANETDHADVEWLIYFAKRLRGEENPPYDFTKIRLIASDEVGSRTIAEEMLQNEALRDAIDVIGLHYTTYGDENTHKLHETYHKEIWYGEGIAPCSTPSLACRVDGSGLGGPNGPLDVANRIMGGYPHGRMVMYEFQPAVSAYYDGSCYSPKQLITANTPWNGRFSVDIGFWIASHFSRFSETGWLYVDGACFGDGEEKHVIRNTTHNVLTLVSPDKTALTMHLSNDSDKPRSYLVRMDALPNLPYTFYLVETAGNADPEHIADGWFQHIDTLQVKAVRGERTFPLVVKPHSLLTLTTLAKAAEAKGTAELSITMPPAKRLSLPFHADFSVGGQTPLFTTDQGGAFEIVETDDGFALEQKITKDNLPTNWRFRGTPEPITCLGDDSWANYRCFVTVTFAESAADNYAAIGMRYNSAVTCPGSSMCGCSIRLYASGVWELWYMEDVLQSGTLEGFDAALPHKLQIMGMGSLILAFVDDNIVAEEQMDGRPYVRSGRISLQSAYYRNRFTDLQADNIASLLLPYADRIDCLSPVMRYTESPEHPWLLDAMASYQYCCRTRAVGHANAVMEMQFYGTGVALLGTAEQAVVRVTIDGKVYAERLSVEGCKFRESFFALDGMPQGQHALKLEILEGELALDAAEIPSANEIAGYLPKALPAAKQTAQKSAQKKTTVQKMALPIAGAAAAGLALAFTVRALTKKKK